MQSLLQPALQMVFISGLLYGYYHLFLRNGKFHRYNRFYLLSAIILSLSIPFINIPLSFSPEQAESSFVIQTFRMVSTDNSVPVSFSAPENTISRSIDMAEVIKGVFIAVLLMGFIRLLFSIYKLYVITKKNVSEWIGKILFIHTRIEGTPFSFFHWLFWNDEIEINSDQGKKILRHELYHIEKKHSADILFVEMVCIIGWFNPFYYLIKKEMRAIHEFLADEYAVSGTDKNYYAELLLMHSLQTRQQLVNPFFQNLIKRRIMMITHSKKTSMQYLRKILVLPLTFLLIGLFAFSYYEKKAEGKKLSAKEVLFEKLEMAPRVREFTLSPDTTGKPLIVVDGIRKHGESLEAINKQIDPNQISKINVLKGEAAIKKYGVAGKNGVIEFLLKKTEKPDSLTILNQSVVHINEKEFTVDPLTLYIGIDNNILIHSGSEKKDFVVSLSQGTISKVSGLFLARVNTIGETILTVALKDGTEIGKQLFNVRYLPNLTEENNEVNNSNPDSRSGPVFYKVEEPASFPGGELKWKQFLETNLNISVPYQQKAPAGNYTAVIQFMVDETGFISDIKPLTRHGYGMEEEAIRLIRKGPKWVPAVQNGRKVKSIVKQKVDFNVEYGRVAVTEPRPKMKTDNNRSVDTLGKPKKTQLPQLKESEIQNPSVHRLLGLPEGTVAVRYTLTMEIENGDLVSIPNYGNRLNSTSLMYLAQLKAGAILTVDNVIIRENGTDRKMLSRIWHVVKD